MCLIQNLKCKDCKEVTPRNDAQVCVWAVGSVDPTITDSSFDCGQIRPDLKRVWPYGPHYNGPTSSERPEKDKPWTAPENYYTYGPTTPTHPHPPPNPRPAQVNTKSY